MNLYVNVNEERLVVAYADPGFVLGESSILAEYNGDIGPDFDLRDNRNIFRFKLVGDVMVERTQEEMDADYAARPAQQPTIEERTKAMEDKLNSYEAAFAEGVAEGWA